MRYLIAFVLLMAGTSSEATVAYGVDLTAPEHHTARVSAEFPQTSGPYLDVMMPAWRTGRYTIMNLASGVSQFAATDGSPKVVTVDHPARAQKALFQRWLLVPYPAK